MGRVTIKVSDVAAIVGLNKWKSRHEVFDELWKKHSPETFEGQTNDDKAKAALATSEVAQKACAEARAVETKSSADAVKAFETARKKIEADPSLNSEQKEDVINHIRSKVYTAHGTRSEDKTAAKVEVSEKTRLVRDDAFYTAEICEMEGTKYVLCGRVDRIEEKPDGTRILVEIKNRTRALFKKVVDYEMVQVQIYLHMLGLENARLVEQHNNATLSHDIQKDPEFWNEIYPKIREFCEELHNVLT